MNSQNYQSEIQIQQEKSLKELGLMLTGKVLSIKTKLKEINPILIYEWDGQTINNQISGKGSFIVRNSLTNQLIFECQVKKWKNGVPIGKIKTKKINVFSNSEITDYKIKEILIYEGQSQNLKKHGPGVYTFQQFYSSGKVRKNIISGEWCNDVLISGSVENDHGKKQLNLPQNLQWTKSAKSIKIDSTSEKKTQKFDKSNTVRFQGIDRLNGLLSVQKG